MSVSICPTLPSAVVTQSLASNSQIIWGPIAKAVIQKSPFLTVLKRGTLPAHLAQSYNAVAQGIPNMGINMAAPPATNWSTTAGTCSAVSVNSGSQTYNYNLFLDQAISTPISLQASYQAVSETLMSTVQSYAAAVTDWIAADVQYQLYLNSGIKVIVQASTDVASMITGTMMSYQTAVPATQATAGLDWNLLNDLNTIMREDNRSEPFPDDTAAACIGYQTLNSLRNQGGGSFGQPVVAYNPIPLGYLAAGGNRMAMDSMVKYAMEVTNRGIAFKSVPRPLRLNWNGAGYDPVNPVIVNASATNGSYAVPNPAWQAASHEVATLVYDNSFEYLTPAAYSGEDMVKFGRQFFYGEPQFITQNLPNNLFNNYGVLGMQFGRAYKPVKPWNVATIIFKRCKQNQLSTCSGVSAS